MPTNSPLNDLRSTASALGGVQEKGHYIFETPIPSGFEDLGLGTISWHDVTGSWELGFFRATKPDAPALIFRTHLYHRAVLGIKREPGAASSHPSLSVSHSWRLAKGRASDLVAVLGWGITGEIFSLVANREQLPEPKKAPPDDEASLCIFRGFTAAISEDSFPFSAHPDLREALLAARQELHPQMPEAPAAVNQQPVPSLSRTL